MRVTNNCFLRVSQLLSAVFVILMLTTVGCDGVINGQRYDACGVCGGDNSTCKLISGLYTKPQLASGYNYITEIPQQACNLSIADLKKTANLLALRYKNGSYILNGNWIPDKAGNYEAVGAIFTLVKGDENSGDIITASGPLLQPLDLLLLYRQPNLGIKYEYRLPVVPPYGGDANVKEPSARSVPLSIPAAAGFPIISSSSSFQYSSGQVSEAKPYYSDEEVERQRRLKFGYNDAVNSNVNGSVDGTDSQGLVRDEESKPKNRTRKKKFIWRITGYTPCSRTCGSGVQMAIISCVKEGNQMQVVHDKRCSTIDKPSAQSTRCTLQPCPSKWVLSDWSFCSVTCGEGVETRNLTCKQETSQDSSIIVADENCLSSPSVNILRTKPCFKQACRMDDNNGSTAGSNGRMNDGNDKITPRSDNADFKPYWYAGPWTSCSAKCGIGIRTRKTFCISTKTNEKCDPNERPSEQATCDAGACGNSTATYSWFTTPWTEQCSETCGTGVQTRKLYCSAGPDSETFCDPSSKPDVVRTCSSEKTCGGQWFSGPWSQCSELCGWGKQQRIVACIASDKRQSFHRIVSNVSCSESDKPSMEQACFERPCSAQWFEGSSWSMCSRKCDSGIQRKEVRCLNPDFQESSECAESEKPPTRRSCNTHKCPQQYNNNNNNNKGFTSSGLDDSSTSEEVRAEQFTTTTTAIAISAVFENKENQTDNNNCQDKYSKCNLVVRARLCNSQYYQNLCCFSCRKA